MNKNIQESILATFLWSNDMGIDTKDAFTLNLRHFTGDLYLVAAKVNEVTATDDKFFGMLLLELENTSPQAWLDISQQTPMPFSVVKRLHDKQPDPRGRNV